MQSGTTRWKRATDWREGPAFLDATSSVSASTFGARRLPELKNLYFQTRSKDADDDDDDQIIHERKTLLSGGGKRSSRHLRRRTTAFHSKKHRHRYPNGHGGGNANGEKEEFPAFLGTTRKSQRKKSSLLELEHLQWLLPVATEANDQTNRSRKKLSWQVTHKWHSKRFYLLSPTSSESGRDPVLGGWTGIPLVHTNRGPRAALRLSQNKDKNSVASSVMVRDVTWELQPLVLKVLCSSERSPSKREEDAQFLLKHLGKICPGLLQPSGGSKGISTFLSGCISMEEIVFALGSFPSGAIGPATSRMVTPKNGETMVEIRCHPSIHHRIQELLEQIEKSIPASSSHRLKTENQCKSLPRICFRLYGAESLTALNKVLKLYQGDASVFLKQHLLQQSSSGLLPNGTIIQIENVKISSEASGTNVDDIVLMYRAPRALDCPANRAIAGWEVHCSDATFGKTLWHALVTLDDSISSTSSVSSNKLSSLTQEKQSVRGCCAIGLIEDSHMRLECEPPLPFFPRDFADTQDSQNYWIPSSSSSTLWKRIRQLCEGGWGRLPIDKERRLDKLGDIDFGKLVSLDEGDEESESEGEKETTPSLIIVVRGAFGQPFVDAIRGSCGNYTPKTLSIESSSSTSNNPSSIPLYSKKNRRNRRPTRPKNQTIIAPSLSKAARVSLGDYCHNVSSSLSLPAVLLVHVRAVGHGRVSPGMNIVCADTNQTKGLILGRITTGGFSISRGVCHGIGVVGAVKLVNYIGRTSNGGGDEEEIHSNSTTSYGRIVRLASGSQSLQLLVRVVNTAKDGGLENSGCEASLSLLI